MPSRQAAPDIAALLREAEVEAERLVSLARVAVALGLMGFFALSVPPVSGITDEMLLRQGVLALATMLAYLVIGGLSWLFIRTGRFHRWMIWSAAMADALFVVANVWISMLNTRLTGDAVFVFPSIWLIPLVLSFGVLRGDPRVLATTAAAMLLGLGGLIVYAAGTGPVPGDSPVWLFLTGVPNVMRWIMIVLAGAVLVLAARRTRALLERSIEETILNANLTRYLPGKLAPQLAEGRLDELRRGRREDVAVLFIDIRGFTHLSEEMTPQQVSDFVTEFRRRVARVVESNDGVIDKFMGDAAMVLFTEPEHPSRAAGHALDCALALHAAIHDWSARRVRTGARPVRAGIGLHFGTVFSGVVGDESRLEYSVFGDTVNVAARLEELSKRLLSPVLASRDVVEAAGAEGWERIAQRKLRGRSSAIDIMAPEAWLLSDAEEGLQ